jgi:hypothetical protein
MQSLFSPWYDKRKTSTTPKDNTITLVEETKNKQGQVSKKHQTYITREI